MRPRAEGSAPFDAGNEAFRLAVRRFVAREITPKAERWDRAETFPRPAIAACARRGYLALDPPRAAILAEELVRCGSLGVGLSVFVQAGLIAPLLEQFGAHKRASRLLRDVRAGRAVSALAVTEPGGGSDLAALQTAAVLHAAKRKAEPYFVIDGEKTYISCAAAADSLIVAARVIENDTPDRHFSLFVVPADARGVRVTRLKTLGLGATAMGRVLVRRCRVPADALLGERGGGYACVQDALNRERLFGGLGAVAWAEYALERTAAFVRTRKAFGKPLGRFQAVRHQLADCATSLAAAAQLNYAAYTAWTAGTPALREIAMVKLFSYREAQRAVELCLQLHGGLGYMDDHWTSRWYRDARALTIAAGTPELMREIIAAHLRL
jgi:acyl-CoA dehydrogenase